MRIPSLDGLRALSILLVIAGHGIPTLPEFLQPDQKFDFLVHNGQIGVHIFFVISGYLITTLLLRELSGTGRIALLNFYSRRAFRIFPAFYAYLATIALLTAAGVLEVPWRMFASSGLYLWNYLHWSESWYLGHTWSLAVEEQYYLLWPALLGYFGPQRARTIAAVIILLSPVARIGSYWLVPESRPYISIMLHTRADALMFGSFLALSWEEPWMKMLERQLRSSFCAVGLLSFLLLLSPWLSSKYKGAYLLASGYTLDGIAISALLIHAIAAPNSYFGRLLNWSPVAWLGRISYSIYLWQQLFLTQENILCRYPPAQFAGAIGTAMVSYYFVEKPFLRWRQRIIG